MARHLGRLGTPRPQREDTFDYFTLEGVRVNPDLTDLLMVDFLVRAQNIDEQDVPAALGATRDFFGSLVHPDDFDQFWQEAVKQRQGVTDLMTTAYDLVEAMSARPTKRRSASSGGRHKTVPKSKPDSSSRVIRQLEKQGRPDLALVVTQARAAQRAG